MLGSRDVMQNAVPSLTARCHQAGRVMFDASQSPTFATAGGTRGLALPVAGVFAAESNRRLSVDSQDFLESASCGRHTQWLFKLHCTASSSLMVRHPNVMERDSDTVQSPTQLEQKEEAIGLVPSHAGLISVDVSQTPESDKPPLLKHRYTHQGHELQ